MQQSVVEMDTLVLDGRKKLNMTCVETVDGFSEQNIKLTVKGNKVGIFGENIKITIFLVKSNMDFELKTTIIIKRK